MTFFAFLFPGQGSQYRGMGKSLAAAYAESREAFDAADHVLDNPISRLCFEGEDSELALTENTQPAILATSIAALRVLESRGLRPRATAGHSLGEYTAHVAAGTLDLSGATRTVRLRGQFMQEAVPVGRGAMAAVLGLRREVVEGICREAARDQVVSCANLNGPQQIVIAGHTEAVERAVRSAREAGARRAIKLPVSAPFHCALMAPAAERLRPVLEALEFRDPQLRVFTNADAAPVTRGDQARDALVRQVSSPVRWQETVEAMIASGIDTFVEVGPGKVLTGLVRRIDRSARVLPAGEPDEIEAAARELGR